MPPELTADIVRSFSPNGPTDPMDYYRRPLSGWMFRERINLGLRMLDGQAFERALEVGFGAGAVQVALASCVRESHGIDLDANPKVATAILTRLGVHATLRSGTVFDLPYPNAYFDLVVSFSVFEHLREYCGALAEVQRVLRPGGHFLLGMPSVNLLMEAGFLAIGYKTIRDHHVTTPAEIERSFAKQGFSVLRTSRFRLPHPHIGVPVYHNWLLQRVS